MALDKAKFKQDFKTLMVEMRTREDNSDEEFAERFANMLDAYVKTATIKYISGLTTPQGVVTGSFVGKLE